MKAQIALIFIFKNMLPLQKLFIDPPPETDTALPPPSIFAAPYRHVDGTVVNFRP